MQRVLSLLLAFLFFQTQCWALSGGPRYPNVASPNQAGNYSGVLYERESDYFSPTTGLPIGEPDRAPAGNIGVFTFEAPITGLATGNIIVFLNGNTFIGSIDGVADPDRRRFDAVIQADGSLDIDFPDPADPTQTITVTPVARGQMKCEVIEDPLRPHAGRPDTTTGNAARLRGEAQIEANVGFVDFTGRLLPVVYTEFTVTGYRQDTTALP